MAARVRTCLLALLLVATALSTVAATPGPQDAVERLPGAEDVATIADAAARETEPVVLTGDAFTGWSVPADVALKANSVEGLQCLGEHEGFSTGAPDTPVTDDQPCSHNRYEEPDASTQGLAALAGAPVDRLIGYRWDATGGFAQVPFQVDEVFVRYLSNDNSGFAMYSETDQHTTYAFDREGFRWTAQHPEDACLARPATPVAEDPVSGLDSDDELVFLARDAGTKAPTGARLPYGIEDVREVAVTDPLSGTRSYLYVALAAEDGPRPAFDAANGYVRYERDADADVFLFSESSYDDYGAAPAGPYWDPEEQRCRGFDPPETDPRVGDPAKQRRPGDQATVTTSRYRFRYEGRWLMTELQVDPTDDGAAVAPDGSEAYADDLVDQWKARAFQQRPGGETPCCGYEEEVNNWGGSSQLLGELAGPVRVVRETWGADSGTNVVRRETFYRDEVRQTSFLRVHVIPPLDGIYVQWDHNALAIDTYRNPYVPGGVDIDGRNDEVFGNSRVHVGPDGFGYEGDDTFTELLGEAGIGTPIEVGDVNEPRCAYPGQDAVEPLYDELEARDEVFEEVPDPTDGCVYNDIDSPDPTFSGPNGLLAWEQVSGPTATIVSRWSTEPGDVTPGGAAHAPLTVPYYRDDACFDDGTGSDPGPHLNSRDVDPDTWADEDGDEHDRTCWTPEDGDGHLGHERYYQGSIGTHGLHILAIADSDNAHLTVPATEMISTQRMVLLPGEHGNVGERYGRGFEKPLVTSVAPAAFLPAETTPDGTWLAGDLHVHTTHSHDSYGGPDDDDPDLTEEPGEAYTLGNTVTEQFAVAGARGLDFLAITDHNDVRSQSDPGFGTSGVVAVPAYEKSLSGHAQMLGADHLYDAGDRMVAQIQRIADELRADGGVFQINHPTDGYTHRGQVDHEHLDWGYGTDVVPDTVEVWNIGPFWQPPAPSASSLDDAIRFWQQFLDAGHRVGATGGSDNHFKTTLAVQGPGQPTTWVLSGDRTATGVLEGLRAGHSFVTWQPPNHGGPRLFLEADADRSGDFESPVGAVVPATADIRVRVEGAPVGSEIRVFGDGGRPHTAAVVASPDDVLTFDAPADATWLRAELVLDGSLGGQEPPYAPLTTVCDELVVAARESVPPIDEQRPPDTTYCRNQVGLLALTSPLYVETEPVATTLTWVGEERATGDTVQAAVELADDAGAPVVDRAVTFTADGATAEGTTDDGGVARATLTVPDHGRAVTVTSDFAGDAAYAASTLTTAVRWGNAGGPGGGSARPDAGTGTAATGTAATGAGWTPAGATVPVIGVGLLLLGLAATAARRRLHVPTGSGGSVR